MLQTNLRNFELHKLMLFLLYMLLLLELIRLHRYYLMLFFLVLIVLGIADIKEAKLYFDGPIMKVNDVVITNIGLKQTREKFLKDGIALEVVPKDEKDFGVINDLGQRDAIIHNIFIHTGIDRDIDEHDIVST